MKFDEARLAKIYDSTLGYCHICRKKLARKNYGKPKERAAWEVDHSIPSAKGGTDRLNNLRAACVSCNRSKQDGSTRTARSGHGHTRAPLSAEKHREAVAENTVLGGLMGLVGGVAFGPGVAIIAAVVGAGIGNSLDPDG